MAKHYSTLSLGLITTSLLLLAHLILPSDAHAISTSLLSIERAPGSPDLLYPALCPAKCKERFGAHPTTATQGHCACICPEDAPVFLTTEGVCVATLAECAHSVFFSTSSPTLLKSSSTTVQTKIAPKPRPVFYPPAIRLPASGGIVNARNPLMWKESGLASLNSCVVRTVYTDDVEHSWKPFEGNLFETEQTENATVLKWIGSDEDSLTLEGSAIQIKLDCAGERFSSVCIAFRLAGKSEYPSARAVVAGSQHRSNLAIIIVLCVLLCLSLFGSFIVWHVCWRIKKERLVTEIQMQFLAHFKQQHDEAMKAATMAALAAQQQHQGPYSPTGLLSHSEFAPPTPPLQEVPAQKRKLFFSIDFFDRHLMENPPPVAEQFRYDLRKMIDVAKERIRMKRYVPQLPRILEEHHEKPHTPRPFPPPRPDKPIVDKQPTNDEPQLEDAQPINQDSPRSGKSVDSGHDSPESGSEESSNKEDSSESSGDEDPRQRNANGAVHSVEAVVHHSHDDSEQKHGSVRRLVDGFESATSPCTPHGPPISTRPHSRIPTLSPRTPPRQLALPLGVRSPPPSASDLPTSPPMQTSQHNAVKRTKNKGYAVFPVDPMLKKSLPRRPKREIPRLNKDN